MDDQRKIGVLRLLFNSTVVKSGNKLMELIGEDGYNEYQKNTANGSAMTKMFGLSRVDDIFNFMNEVNGIQWKRVGEAYITESCPTATIGKQVQAKPTCTGCCLIPLTSMVQAIDSNLIIEMKQNLWEHDRPCEFKITSIK